MKKERGSPFQRLHAVPINSCENSDGSCMPHEVIPQAWMENIDLTIPPTPPPPHPAPLSRQTKNPGSRRRWTQMTFICVGSFSNNMQGFQSAHVDFHEDSSFSGLFDKREKLECFEIPLMQDILWDTRNGDLDYIPWKTELKMFKRLSTDFV